MAIQDFTAGQVLTALQMDNLQANDYNQTVSTKTASYTLVAADKGTRVVMNSASATTITVNTSLFSAGDTLVLQNINTGVCTVTAGTATVSTAGSLAIPQNGSGILYFTSAGVSIFYPSAGVTGKVLQVVQATYNTEMTTTSTSYVTGNFTATITPSLATSKVLIFCAVSGRGPANEQQRLTIFRGTVAGTNLATDGLASQGAINSQATITFLDSPNTTSAQVYTLATKSAASGTSVLHIANTTSVFVLIEIGA